MEPLRDATTRLEFIFTFSTPEALVVAHASIKMEFVGTAGGRLASPRDIKDKKENCLCAYKKNVFILHLVGAGPAP